MSEQRSEVRGQRSAGSKARLVLLVTAYWLLVTSSHADTHYVSTNGLHQAPFTNWVNAATNIQAAINASTAGDTVLVTNGVYDSGYHYADGWNRISVNKAITVQSINGPDATVVAGQGPSGSAAVRCASLVGGAQLVGFSLREGHTQIYTSGTEDNTFKGGAVLCTSTGIVRNCVIYSNSASFGGAVSRGIIVNSILSDCEAEVGGALHSSSAYGCILFRNRAQVGGAAYASTLENCTAAENTANFGGGVCYGTARNSILFYNQARVGGDNWMAADSPFSSAAAAAYFNGVVTHYWVLSTFDHLCTSPLPAGIGHVGEPPQILAVDNPRLLISSPCLNVGVNRAWMTNSVDMDNEPRVVDDFVDIGADEFVLAGATGPLIVALSVDYTNVVVGRELVAKSRTQGRASGLRWDFGDGLSLSNQCTASHAYAVAGEYQLTLTAWNTDFTAAATATIHVVLGFTNYVATAGGNVAPFSSWSTAATNIQDAVLANCVAGGTTLVSNGLYGTGGECVYRDLTNRVAIVAPIRVESVNGPGVTTIEGRGPNGSNAIRCAYIMRGASLVGFTLTNGHTLTLANDYRDECGGGVFCELGGILSNCVVRNCAAGYGGGGICFGGISDCEIRDNVSTFGSGAMGAALQNCDVAFNFGLGSAVSDCVLDNCSIMENSGGGAGSSWARNCLIARNRAGGAQMCNLRNCTIVANISTASCAGVASSALDNCIVYDNQKGTNNQSNVEGSTCRSSCTTPNPGGTNNITSVPAFVDFAAGDYRLLATSPCIDVGDNSDWMSYAVDLDGNPRIFNGRVDMGAYEFTMRTSLRAFLQGPYSNATHSMTLGLMSNGQLPQDPPYADSRKIAEAIPSNAVDWVVAQLLETNTYKSVAVQSALLRSDGVLVSAAGTTDVVLQATPNRSYYLVMKQRNHLSVMSANPIPYTSTVVMYDFTTNAGQFYGGTNACVELEPGVWGMIAGDADGDGKITAVDRAIVSNQLGKSGYLSGDLNLDGHVTGNE